MGFFNNSKINSMIEVSSVKPEGSFNSDHKVFIREKWNKPIIKFLAKKVNDRLVYMGLPASNGEDVASWIEFIKTVIAFQCREYGKQSESTQSREDIEKLESFLMQLERERKIDNFMVYDGYLEEVVLRGFDNSPSRLEFEQDKIVTLYNLDFCNDIASPINYVDKDGEPKVAYKFNAIRRLLEIQRGLGKVSDKFVFLLTVHCSYRGQELQDFINFPPSEVEPYLKKYNQLSGHDKNARIVKLFVCHQILQFFPSYEFCPKILPVIKYDGLNKTPLLHFVILGYKPPASASGISVYQSLNEMIETKFLHIESEAFANLESDLENVRVSETNPVSYFTQSTTYQKHWI
jgi:hypothetical protein